jgi:hypothetical protein
VSDPFQVYGERLDPRVAGDLGAFAVTRGTAAVLHTDGTLHDWVRAATESDLRLLERLGGRMSRWTASDSETAGFALATWGRLEGVAVEEWLPDYRRVLGDVVSWDVEAQAAYRQAQLAASSEETAMVWARDRWDEAAERLPAVLTAFDRERLAMERAARGIAAARELRSREIGITIGPRDDPAWRADFAEAFPDGSYEDYLTFAAPVSPVSDPRAAIERCGDGLGDLRDRAGSVGRHAESMVEAFGASDLESLDALRAKVVAAMPQAEAVAAEGRLPVPAGVRESLRMEHVQRVAAEKYIEQMRIAGEVRWGAADHGDSSERLARHDRALEAAGQQRAIVTRIDAALDRRREQGRDAATWFASGERDDLTRGLALYAVTSELERERVRDAARGGPDVGTAPEPPVPDLGADAPEADVGYG